jgi:hypothetical protein
VQEATDFDADQATTLAAWVVQVHRLAPGVMDRRLPRCAVGCASLQQQLNLIALRLDGFEQAARSPAVPLEVQTLARELRVGTVLAPLVDQAVAGLSPEVLASELPEEALRLNTGDFAVHNLLTPPHRASSVVDFEAAGWDDPARMVMGFVAHAGSEDMAPAAREAFLNTYAEGMALSRAERERFQRIGVLLDVEWTATYASALTEDALAAKRFADAEFDLTAHIARVTDKLKARLARAKEGIGYRLL